MSINENAKKIETDRKWIHLEGLHCANCAAKIEHQVRQLNDVVSAQVNLLNQTIEVEVGKDAARGLVEQVRQIVDRTEPGVKVYEDQKTREGKEGAEEASEGESLKKEIMLRGLGAVLFGIALLIHQPGALRIALFFVSYLIIGGEVLWRAGRNIIHGQIFDENFLMALATVGAFAVKEFPEAVAVMLFYQIGETFQDLAVDRSRRSIKALMDIRPEFANIEREGEIIQVDPASVNVGDRIIVKPGERVPLDGIILEGQSMMDTSALTGESLPRSVQVNAEVLAGFININGLLKLQVTRTFGESTVAKILDMVQNASTRKAPTENFITKFARYYTPAVVFSALAIAVIPPLVIPGASWASWLYRGLIFLVVSCPCALVISIPLSFFGGIGGASKRGILIKGGNFLEALNEVRTIVFDKTGTLTKGVFKVTKIVPALGHTAEEVLRYAALAEAHSNHPIAKSVLEAYAEPVYLERNAEYEEITGHGVRVSLNGETVLAGNLKLMQDNGFEVHTNIEAGTVVYVALNGDRYLGYIAISDEVKEDASEALDALRGLGIKELVMLTGDVKEIGEKVAADLHLDRVYAGLLPDEKVLKVEELMQREGFSGKVVFVGDGINDAPVLARADIGVAMGGLGSDAAIEAADIVLMTDEPSKLVDALKIARKTRVIVWQNIVFALGIKAAVLLLGALGIATMWEAVFADVGVALIAVLNAMRVMGRLKN